MNKIFLIILAITIKLQAQVILVPSKGIPLDHYLERCKIEGYQCTQDYFKHTLMEKKSIAFDQFIETLDLYSEEYRRTLLIKTMSLLTEENLNLDQIGLLIKIITRFESIDKNVNLSQIKKELKELSYDVQNIYEEKSDEESYILFNKILTKKQYLSLRYKQKYTKTIKITPYTEPTTRLSQPPKYLIEGDCNQSELSHVFTGLRTMVTLGNCSSSQAYTGQTSTPEIKWKDYQKPLLYTVAAAVLIGLFSQYQFEVTY